MKRRHQGNVFCPACRKPLKAAPCVACSGNGYPRQLLISKRPCTRCNGSGKVYRCYDRLSHYENELMALRQRKIDEWIRSYGQSVML